MLRLIASSALLASTAPAQQAHPYSSTPAARAVSCHPPTQADGRWDGMGIVKGGKGYATTPMGQVHYRLMGPANGPVLLLIHQTPWSLVEWADIQPCLAERGIRTLAIDTPGYGMSDAPEGRPSMQRYADNIVPVLDQLRLTRVAVAGHHTGAAIAAALAARHPERISGVILHGAPNYNPQERAQRLALPEPDMTLKPDGSHLSDYYAKIWKAQGDSPRNLVTVNWSTLNLFLAGASDVAHAQVYNNDMAADLRRIDVPLLVLSDGADALNAIDRRTGAMKPNFRYSRFSDGSAHALLIEPARWSDVAAGFVKALPAK